MEPPICSICRTRFDPGDGALIRFRRTGRGRTFAERQSAEGIVGHHPDDGWFCEDHVEPANKLSGTATLADALAELREPASASPLFEVPEPAVISDDLGNGYRTDSGAAIEWSLDWLAAADVRRRCTELVALFVAALEGTCPVDLVEASERRPDLVEGSGPEHHPYRDAVTIEAGTIEAGAGSTDVEIRHEQLHLDDDTVVEANVRMAVTVTDAFGAQRSAVLVAWATAGSEHCGRLRLTGTVTGPVVEGVRTSFALGTDRWNQRFDDSDPVCLSCDQPFVAETGGQAVFRVDAAGHDWNARLRDGQVEGSRPYQGWFCNRHIGPAQLVSNRLSRMEAMPLLAPRGRPPLEYREHPDGVEITADEFGEPSRAPFVPVDDDFAPSWTNEFDMTPRIANDTQHILSASLGRIATTLGADHLRGFGTNSIGTAGYSSFQSGEFSAFLFTSGRVGLVLQRRERTLLEVRARSGSPRSTAPDGERLLERLTVRAASDDIAVVVADHIAALVAELSADVADPFDLSPDLVDVELHGAEIVRGLAPGASLLTWSIQPVAVSDMFKRLTEMVGPLAGLLGVDAEPELVTTTRRTWSPMDGAREPNCPYTDMTQRRGTASDVAGELSVVVDEVRTHWNDDDLSSVSAAVVVDLAGRSIRVSASGREQAPACTRLSLSRPVPQGTIELLDQVFEISRALG